MEEQELHKVKKQKKLVKQSGISFDPSDKNAKKMPTKIKRNRSISPKQFLKEAEQEAKKKRTGLTEKILICIIIVEVVTGSLYWLWYYWDWSWFWAIVGFIIAGILIAVGVSGQLEKSDKRTENSLTVNSLGTFIWYGMFIVLGIVIPPLGVGMLIYWILKETIADGVKKGIKESKKIQ